MNNGLEVDDGEEVTMSCELSFGGDTPNWRVEWQRNDTKLSSMTDDVYNRVRRKLSFVARYGESGGTYTCTVSSRSPDYMANCSKELRVLCRL